MSILETPEFEEPAIPTREYWTSPAWMVKTNDRTRPGTGDEIVDNLPVKKEWEHNLEVEEYNAKRKVYNNQVLA